MNERRVRLRAWVNQVAAQRDEPFIDPTVPLVPLDAPTNAILHALYTLDIRQSEVVYLARGRSFGGEVMGACCTTGRVGSSASR